jgi:hypothetical protein
MAFLRCDLFGSHPAEVRLDVESQFDLAHVRPRASVRYPTQAGLVAERTGEGLRPAPRRSSQTVRSGAVPQGWEHLPMRGRLEPAAT